VTLDREVALRGDDARGEAVPGCGDAGIESAALCGSRWDGEEAWRAGAQSERA